MVSIRAGKVGKGAVLRSAVMVGVLAMGWGANDAVASGYMVTGGLTSQPIGHYEFCKANPAECSIHPQDLRPAQLTRATWDMIVGVNDRVNAAVKPMSDYDIYGKDEVWAYPDKGVGDCEDYVLEKRRDLARAGFSLADLLITVVRKPDGEGHAVLTVRTDKGDYILDNLSDKVKLWTHTPYRYLKRQAEDDTGHWVSIRSGDNMLVSAVK
ncbi:MAG: transglutaminase-like cysteine peptidase [Devosia sp.]